MMNTRQFKKIKRFMAIGAHSDDIELRCGGTFARLVRQGAEGCYVVVVNGPWVNPLVFDKIKTTSEAIAIRKEESRKAARHLGAKQVELLGWSPSNYYKNKPSREFFYPSFSSLDKVNEELKDVVFTGAPRIQYASRRADSKSQIETLIRKWKPEIIFSHYACDGHHDHNAVSYMIGTILRDSGLNQSITYMQWRSGSIHPMVPYCPTTLVELSKDDILRQQKALECCPSQFPGDSLNSYAFNSAEAYGELCSVKYAQPFVEAIYLDRYNAIKNVREFIRAEYRQKPPEVIRL